MIVKSMLVRIGADASAMKASLGKASKTLKSHSAQFKKAGMAMTVAGAAITGAVGLMVKSYMSAGDEVHKMALRTGFGTESLSELKYAAEISGASLDDVEKGVKKMSKTIMDANDGLATYVRAFDRVGLKAEELIDLSPEDQFDKIAKAIASVENPTIRAATAQEIFGRAGTKLLPLFAAGEEGLDALRQKARDMGIVFDQEAADKAAMLTDSLTTLKGSFSGVSMSIANTLAPVITQIVEKISSVAQKIKDWMKEHPKLSGTIMKVVVVLGGLMAVLGPLVMILPAIVAGVTMLGGAFSVLLGPIGLVIAAVATATIVFMKLKKAKDEVRKADERLVEAQKSLRQKLIDMKNAAGMTGEEFGKLNNKYKGNIVAMTMAIHKGKEGEKLQKALADVSKKHKEEIDKQREGYEKIVPKIDGYQKKLQEIPAIVKTMTDEIKKATLSEYEYAKMTLKQKYEDRVAAIATEIEDETAREEAIALLKETHRLQEEELDKEHKKKEAERQEELTETMKTRWQDYWAAVKAQLMAYEEKKHEILDSIKKMTMDELTYKTWAFDEEKKKEEQKIRDTIASKEKRDELLALLDEKYLLKKEKANQVHKDKMTDLEAATFQTMTALYGDFIYDTLSAFEGWAEGSMGLLKGIGMAFKNLAKAAIQALKDIVVQEAISAVKTLIKEKAKAIAKVITSVMALPFPFNVLAVGGAIAAVTLLFSKIKLFKEGGFVPKQTLAMLHPGEYVLPAPQVSAISKGGGMGGGLVITQKNYFYGNISNVGDLDEISKRLAQRTRRAIERGRR